MYNDIIKLLNLEQFNLKIKTIHTTKENNILLCHITLNKQPVNCASCGSEHLTVKEYYPKKIKHSISTNNPCFIIYKARRYLCKICGTTFYESNPFSALGDQTSTYTRYAILEALKDHTATFQSVARRFNVSTTTVIRIFDSYVDPKRRRLPEVICIDEFYTSKTRQYKYACVLLDFHAKKIIDIYSSRHKNRLSKELAFIPRSERYNVKYVVIDMWEPYLDISQIYFPKALVAVDSFHVIKHLNQAIDTIRIRIMRGFDKRSNKLVDNDKLMTSSSIYYYMLKKFHYFFTKNFENIFDGQIMIHKMRTKWTKHEIRRYLFSIDQDLEIAYFLKEQYREFNLTASYDTCDKELQDFIERFQDSQFPEYREFGRLLYRWQKEIKNSFIRYQGKRLSNGPVEGANSRIKTIFKSANGYTNFGRLRNRIIYSLNKDVPLRGNPK